MDDLIYAIQSTVTIPITNLKLGVNKKIKTHTQKKNMCLDQKLDALQFHVLVKKIAFLIMQYAPCTLHNHIETKGCIYLIEASLQ